MLDHISEKKDIKSWLEMYKNMKKVDYGLIIGLLGYLFINYNMLKYKKIEKNIYNLLIFYYANDIWANN